MSEQTPALPDIHAHFSHHWGLTPEQVLTHGAITVPGKSMWDKHITVPDFVSNHLPEILEHIKSNGGNHPLIGTADDWKRHVEKALSDRDAALATPHDTLVRDAIRRFQFGDGGNVVMGMTVPPSNESGKSFTATGWKAVARPNIHQLAASVMALGHTLRGESRPNDDLLYRGMSATRTPNQDLEEPRSDIIGRRGFISFSENKSAARSFVQRNRNETGKPSATYTLGLEEGRGIRIADYGALPRTIGNDRVPEDEWFITNIGRQFKPKKSI